MQFRNFERISKKKKESTLIIRKQTKVAVAASAATLFAIGASMTSFAATGWVEEDGAWYYYDKDGNRVSEEWKKSGENWYWMDSEENGAMSIDKLIEDGGDTYYVDGNGERLTGDSGWSEPGTDDYVYYFGGWENGSMKTGWRRISVYDDGRGKDDDYDYWFNFKANGQKNAKRQISD